MDKTTKAQALDTLKKYLLLDFLNKKITYVEKIFYIVSKKKKNST